MTNMVKNVQNVGDLIRLKVGIHKGIHTFLPRFENYDLREGSCKRSVQIFKTDSTVDMAEGEEWNVVVTKINITEKLSLDDRRYTYITVKTLSRHVEETNYVDRFTEQLIKRTISGTRILEEQTILLNKVPVHHYRHEGSIVVAEVYKMGDKVVHHNFHRILSKKDYLHELANNIGTSVNPKSLLRAIDKMPELPTLQLAA